MISTRTGIARLVRPRKVRIVCPWLVMRSIARNACVIQITPVSVTSTTAKDISVVRRMYLSSETILGGELRLEERTFGARPEHGPAERTASSRDHAHARNETATRFNPIRPRS